MPNQFAARDANNNIVTLESLPTVGQKANAASLPVTLSTEQNTTLSAIASSVAGTIAVSGTFWQATQPVSLTTLPALVAGSSVIGKVSIDQTTPGTTNLVEVGGTLPQGTNIIGGVLGRQVGPSATPTVTASSGYTAGNLAGGKLTFASAVDALDASGILQSIVITCKTVQTTALKLYLFNSDPSATTWTDKTAPAINAADVGKLIAVYTLYPDSGLGTHTLYSLEGIGKDFRVSSGTSIYGVVTVVATPTFGSTSDLVVNLGILKG